MPPSESPPSNVGQSTAHADPYYSNEDVEILHNIVVLAQELLPNLPERERLPTNALFNAYYDILPRAGINADHDSRYARIIFKIGGLRGPGTLYDKFEEILLRMGIEIQLDTEEYDSQLEASQTEQDLPTTGETSPQDANNDHGNRPRCNSESTAWDLVHQAHSPPRTRRNSFSSVGPIKPSIESKLHVQQQRPTSATPLVNGDGAPQQNDGNNNVRTWLSPRSDKARRRRIESTSTHDGAGIEQKYPTSGAVPPKPASDDYHAASEFSGTTTDFDDETSPKVRELLQTATPYDEPSPLMEIKASKILQYNTALFAKLQLRRWKEKASQAREKNGHLDQLAIDHDKKALLTSALDAWRASLREREVALQEREEAERREYYEELEQRAEKARDRLLVRRAFTHWANYSNEQVQRTARAREYVVKARVLCAWKEETQVDDSTARKQVLKKFMTALKQRKASKLQANAFAIQVYQDNLVEKIYRQWVEKIRDIKATKWHADQIKHRAISQWVDKCHNHEEDNRVIADKKILDLMRKTWRIWREKIETRARMNQEAEKLYEQKLFRNLMGGWRRETQVIPASKAVETDVKARLLRDTLATWKLRAQQENQAEDMDRKSICREALTQWRLKTRLKEMKNRIDERVVQQSVRSLDLATKAKKFEQEKRQTSLQQVLRIWKSKQKIATEQRLEQEDRAQSFTARRTENLVLRQWYSRMETKQRNESAAVNFYAPRLVRGVMTQWTNQLKRVHNLEQRSQDADFYFLASKTLKKWKAATEASKREKRKGAYIQVRKNHKINLARGILTKWRNKTQSLITLEAQAEEISHDKSVTLAINILDRWRARTEAISELESLAQGNVLKKQFAVWKDRSNALQALTTEATLVYQEQQQTRALKKWNLQTLQVRAQSNYATEIREKNLKRNYRKMFQYWQQKTAEKRPPKSRPPKPREMSKSVRFETPSKGEAWLDSGQEFEVDEFGKDFDEAATSMPLPGYLNTPSKRSERVNAAAARFSTTPKAPLSTPVEKQLRAQWSGALLQTHRRTPVGKSSLRLGGAFPDLPGQKKPPDLQKGSALGWGGSFYDELGTK